VSLFFLFEEISWRIYVEWYDIVRTGSSRPTAFEIDVVRGYRSLPRGVLKDAADCAVKGEYYCRSDSVRSMDCSHYPARLSMIASGGCILVCDLTRRELEKCLICCLIEKAMIVLEILIEAGRSSLQRANLATLVPLQRKVEMRSICCYLQAIEGNSVVFDFRVSFETWIV
jgi:hypothetical protein